MAQQIASNSFRGKAGHAEKAIIFPEIKQQRPKRVPNAHPRHLAARGNKGKHNLHK
jgi:hypothetical protein